MASLDNDTVSQSEDIDFANSSSDDDSSISPKENAERLMAERFAQYIKRGKTSVYHARGLFIGCAGAGKTTLLKGLQGINTKKMKAPISTRGIEVYMHAFLVEEDNIKATDKRKGLLLAISTDNLTEQKESKDDASQKSISGCIKGTQKRICRKDESSRDEQSNSEDSEDENTSDGFYLEEDTEFQERYVKKIFTEEERRNGDEKREASASAFTGEVNNESIKFTSTMLPDILENEAIGKTVSFLDFAGQFAYYACHQIYMSPTAFYVLVMDMSKKFNAIPDKHNNNQKGSAFKEMSFKDYIIFWLKSIHTYGSEDAPVFLIATHAGKKTRSDVDKFFTSVWDIVQKEDEHLLSHLDKSREFSVELKGSCDRELGNIKREIVNVVQRQSTWGQELPTSWVFLEQKLSNYGEKIITLSEICELNRDIPPEFQLQKKEELNDFLKFKYQNGSLLYFYEGDLREYVILDVQWFMNAFSLIIADENHVTKDCKRQLIQHWRVFNKTGELEDNLIQAMWEGETSYLKNKMQIMKFMQRLGLAASDETRKIWYVPCMNKMQFKRNILTKFPKKSSILCLQYKYFPIFLFYRLVVYCIGTLRWTIQKDEGTNSLYQTAAVFLYKDHNIFIGSCRNSLQVQVVCLSTVELQESVTREIGIQIQEGLHYLKGTFQRDLVYKIGCKCRLDSFCIDTDESFLAYDDQTGNECMQCRFCDVQNPHHVDVKSLQRFWREVEEIGRPRTSSAAGRVIPFEIDPTRKKRNFKKFAELVKIGQKALIILFNSLIPPVELKRHLEKYKQDLTRGQYHFKAQEVNILYPDSVEVCSDMFDITILYKLLRNTTHLKDKQGWSKYPMLPETSLVHDIERVKQYRNDICHNAREEMDDDGFYMQWMDLKMAIERISKGLLKEKITALEVRSAFQD